VTGPDALPGPTSVGPAGITISYHWRGPFTDAEVNGLHAEAFGHEVIDDDWWARVNRHSLGWVCARTEGALVGFVNVAWEGDIHAFILDAIVAKGMRRAGIGQRLIATAADGARAARCHWLHVDFEDQLTGFYLRACGFTPTRAGLLSLA
jgi:ribosomal protein S18 acetylase RimI-like enzyme